jgi:phytoene dehydrogenase-like protein
MRSPVVRLHIALDGLPSIGGRAPWSFEALGGTITLADDLVQVERAYDAAKHRGIAPSPCLQLSMPSLHDPTLAPPGQHVMTVHAQFASYHLPGGWTTERQREAVEAVLARLGQWAPELSKHVIQIASYTPADVEREFLVHEGSTLHGELALDQFLFMRPVPQCARYATPVPGLWLCGSSVHPGAGTACASGWLAAREVMNAWKQGER